MSLVRALAGGILHPVRFDEEVDSEEGVERAAREQLLVLIMTHDGGVQKRCVGGGWLFCCQPATWVVVLAVAVGKGVKLRKVCCRLAYVGFKLRFMVFALRLTKRTDCERDRQARALHSLSVQTTHA